MQFYSKAALQLIYDQVNRDNPDLPVALSPDNAALTKTPVSVSVGTYGRNTRVEFTAYPGSGLQGACTLYYDRVNLTSMFNFVPLIYPEDTMLTHSALLPVLNEALGLNLSVSDLSVPDRGITKPGATAQSTTMPIIASSPAFTGQITFQYQLQGTGFYPKSGPGPKSLLFGDTVRGYFGIVDAGDLYGHQELINAVWSTGNKPTVQYNTIATWYKFFFNGKVLYIPTYPVGSGMSWNSLYQNGLVYGADGNGKYPGSPAVDQGKIFSRDSIAEGKFYYRVRLPSCGADPFTQATSLGSGDYANSEMEMFNWIINGKWAAYTGVWTQWAYMMNSVITNPTTQYKLATFQLNNWANNTKATEAQGWYWWPVLELVDPANTVLAIEALDGRQDAVLHIPVVFTPEQTLNVKPMGLGQPKTIDFQPIPFETSQSFSIKPMALGQPKTIDFTPIPFSVEIYTPEKVALDSTNGDLDGF